MTSWHGHRDDQDIPEVARAVWKKKFQPGGGGGSNVDACVLDSKGSLVRAFDAMPVRRDGGGVKLHGSSLAEFWKAELGEARTALKLKAPGEARPVKLPGLPDDAKSGMRVFTRLYDNGMPAYAAPVVEVVTMDAAAWTPLAIPLKPRPVDPMDLLPWLSKMFPGGVMERTDQETKRVYDVTGATGELTLSPAGASSGIRYSLLQGRVALTDSGGGGFEFGGDLSLVLGYPPDASEAESARGFLEGTYPRRTPQGDRVFRLVGVFEGLRK